MTQTKGSIDMIYKVGDREIKYFGAIYGETHPIPYTYAAGPVFFFGILYFHTRRYLESFTEGIITGLTVPVSYHIDKDNPEAWGTVDSVKWGLIVDIKSCKMWVQDCHHTSDPIPKWDCNKKKLVLEW